MEAKEPGRPKPIDFNLRTKKILSVDWNHSGNYLAFFSTDSDIKIWNYEENDISRAFDLRGHEKRVGQISWKPKDDNILASVGHDCTLKLWDLRSENTKSGGILKPLHNEKTKDPNFILSWHPEGNTIAIGNDKEQVSFYDTRNWKVIQTVGFQDKKCELNQIEWDKTGNMLFIPNTTGSVYVLDGNNPDISDMEVINAHFGTVFCISVSHDNQFLATGSADSNL